MPLFRLALHDREAQRLTQMRWHTKFEELAVMIMLDVHGVIAWINPGAISPAPARWDFADLQASADLGEPGFNMFGIHTILFAGQRARGGTPGSASRLAGFE